MGDNTMTEAKPMQPEELVAMYAATGVSLAGCAALMAIPGKYAQPDPSTLAKLPKPTSRDNPKGKCDVCGGWHGLPAIHLDYMGHAEITLALIEIDPNWNWEPLAIEDGVPVITKEGNRLVLWARLTVLGKSVIGVGTCEAGKPDPEKELIGDFLRNAAMRFGIATKLWSKAIDADAAGTGGSGGYDRPRKQPLPTPTQVRVEPGVIALFERVKAAAGTPVADELKAFAADNNLKLNLPTLAADPQFAAQVADILDKATT